MKTIPVILMLLSSSIGLRAQGSISDPFFNHGQARSLNSRIIAPLQPVPGFVNEAIAGMRAPNNRNLVRLAHLKDDYGYAVWDQAKTFTAAGRETALIPMVRPEGDAINGILVAVKDGSTFRYGVMDTETPFPYAFAAPGTPGMPSMRDVLALSVIFNHALFGEVDCSLVQALRALSNNNVRGQTAGGPKSCFVYVYYAGEYCQHVYGTYLDGTIENMYSDCHDIYNYQLICDTNDSADNEDGGSGDGGSGGGSGGGNGSSGPGDSGESVPCNGGQATPCAGEVFLDAVGPYDCWIFARISGCDYGTCTIVLESHGVIGCGIPAIGDFPAMTWQLTSSRCTSWLARVTSSDPTCSISTRCGYFSYRYVVNFYLAGIQLTSEVHTGTWGENCYDCRNCPE